MGEVRLNGGKYGQMGFQARPNRENQTIQSTQES